MFGKSIFIVWSSILALSTATAPEAPDGPDAGLRSVRSFPDHRPKAEDRLCTEDYYTCCEYGNCCHEAKGYCAWFDDIVGHRNWKLYDVRGAADYEYELAKSSGEHPPDSSIDNYYDGDSRSGRYQWAEASDDVCIYSERGMNFKVPAKRCDTEAKKPDLVESPATDDSKAAPGDAALRGSAELPNVSGGPLVQVSTATAPEAPDGPDAGLRSVRSFPDQRPKVEDRLGAALAATTVSGGGCSPDYYTCCELGNCCEEAKGTCAWFDDIFGSRNWKLYYVNGHADYKYQLAKSSGPHPHDFSIDNYYGGNSRSGKYFWAIGDDLCIYSERGMNFKVPGKRCCTEAKQE